MVGGGFGAFFRGRRKVVVDGGESRLGGRIFAPEGRKMDGVVLEVDLCAHQAMLPGRLNQIGAAEHNGLAVFVGAAQIDERA